MSAYYNEIDPDAVAILRQCIADGVIAPGDVDTRSIKEVQADDLRGYSQCHFFAGGGLWSVAARMAGWPDGRPLWTGSCPCQPFSAAGKGAGVDDPRHLWPDLLRLVRDASAAGFGPPVLLGEQVSGAAGYGWLDGVRADLAGEDYACRARDIPACGVDAPHQRNRLYWVAVVDAESERRGEGRTEHELRSRGPAAAGADASGHVGNGFVSRLEGYAGHGDGSWRPEQDRSASASDGAGASSDVGNAPGDGRQQGEPWTSSTRHGRVPSPADFGRNGSNWADAEWIVCHDGKARRAKPGLRLLVDGLPGRVGLWRVGGNAIVPVLAAEVIGALLDAEEDMRAAA